MPTILIVEDDALGRKFLIKLLGHKGHRLLEASNGEEALVQARTQKPDLVIADVHMPIVDGPEFVRRLRSDPEIASTRVIFYAPSYYQQEAQELARTCGVQHLLIKPARPAVILRTVDAALVGDPPPTPQSGEMIDREHIRLATNLLVQENQELQAVNSQLDAVLDLGQRLTLELGQQKLLETFAQAARDILKASYAAVGMLDATGRQLSPFLISGLDTWFPAQQDVPSPQTSLLRQLLTRRRPVRRRDLRTDADAADFLQHHPPVSAFLGVPIATPVQVYGILCVTRKPGMEEFNTNDVHVASTLAGQLAVAYENLRRYEEIQSYAARLEKEMANRIRAEEKFRLAMEYAPSGQMMVNRQGQMVLVNRQTERMFGYTREELLGQSVEMLIPERFRLQHRSFVTSFFANPEERQIGVGRDLFGRRKDGSEFLVEIGLCPLVTREGLLILAALVESSTPCKQV